MLGIGLILALLAVSFIGHNMSMVYSCLILLALRFLLPHSALEYVAGHGINWGVITLLLPSWFLLLTAGSVRRK